MLATFLRRVRLTEGERSLAVAVLCVSLFGAGIAFTIAHQFSGAETLLRPLTRYDLWVVASGGLGSGAALYLGANWLGSPRERGVLRALAGVPVITVLAAICGGTLALPFYGTMFGPFAVAVTFWSNPLLALLWSASLIGAHLLVGNWRRERYLAHRDIDATSLMI